MTDWVLGLVADWGALALAVVTFLSCLAVPVPSSVMMLSAGAFAASGDLSLASAGGSALAGAVLGDQAGYGLGRLGYRRAEDWLLRNPARASVLGRAQASLEKGGSVAVFVSRWLFSALGPYVNLLAGGAGMHWLSFTLAGVLGEIVWVAVYLGLGYLAGEQLAQASALLSNALGLLASLSVTLGLGWLLWKRRNNRRRAAG